MLGTYAPGILYNFNSWLVTYSWNLPVLATNNLFSFHFNSIYSYWTARYIVSQTHRPEKLPRSRSSAVYA